MLNNMMPSCYRPKDKFEHKKKPPRDIPSNPAKHFFVVDTCHLIVCLSHLRFVQMNFETACQLPCC
jgi:hypothetical protein